MMKDINNTIVVWEERKKYAASVENTYGTSCEYIYSELVCPMANVVCANVPICRL